MCFVVCGALLLCVALRGARSDLLMSVTVRLLLVCQW